MTDLTIPFHLSPVTDEDVERGRLAPGWFLDRSARRHIVAADARPICEGHRTTWLIKDAGRWMLEGHDIPAAQFYLAEGTFEPILPSEIQPGMILTPESTTELAGACDYYVCTSTDGGTIRVRHYAEPQETDCSDWNWGCCLYLVT